MIQCYFCSATVSDVEQAIDADWAPSFFVEDLEYLYPVCSECQVKKLVRAADGETLELPPTPFAIVGEPS